MACGLERSRYGDLGPGHGEAVSAAAQILHRDLLAVLVGYVDLIDLIACVGGDGDGDGIALGGLTGIDGDGAAVCFDGSHGRGGRCAASAATAARAATAAASASTATAGGGLLRPVGVEGGVFGIDLVGAYRIAAFSRREPAVEGVTAAGRGGQRRQLSVFAGLGGAAAAQCAAVGVKGDGEGCAGCGRDDGLLHGDRVGHVAAEPLDRTRPNAALLGEVCRVAVNAGDVPAVLRLHGDGHRGTCGILVTDLVGTGQGHGVVLGAFCGGVCDREEVQLAGFDRDIQIPRQVFDDQIFGQAGIRGPVVLPCGHVGGAVGAVVGKFHLAARSDGIAGSNGLPIRSGRDIVRKLYGEVRHGLEGD